MESLKFNNKYSPLTENEDMTEFLCVGFYQLEEIEVKCLLSSLTCFVNFLIRFLHNLTLYIYTVYYIVVEYSCFINNIIYKLQCNYMTVKLCKLTVYGIT